MRKTGDFINAWVNWRVPITSSPKQFIYWSAVALVSAALKRNAKFRWLGYDIYPNMYIILIGPPSVGKGLAIKPALECMQESKVINTLTDRINAPYILEKLNKGFSSIQVNNNGNGVVNLDDRTVVVVEEELPNLVRRDEDMLVTLTKLWDASNTNFQYGTRHHGEFAFKEHCLSLYAGASPKALAQAIPYDSISTGFTRRVNFIYGSVKDRRPLKVTKATIKAVVSQDQVRNDFVEDLKYIASHLHGIFTLHPTAEDLFVDYYNFVDTDVDSSDEEMVQYFKGTKIAHTIKLAMALSASRRDDLVIHPLDLGEAINEVKAVEGALTHVFAAVEQETSKKEISEKIVAFALANEQATGTIIYTKRDLSKAVGGYRVCNKEDFESVLGYLVITGVFDEIGTATFKFNKDF